MILEVGKGTTKPTHAIEWLNGFIGPSGLLLVSHHL
jgi:hypothetical protein